jgi:hypothetical protein
MASSVPSLSGFAALKRIFTSAIFRRGSVFRHDPQANCPAFRAAHLAAIRGCVVITIQAIEHCERKSPRRSGDAGK